VKFHNETEEIIVMQNREHEEHKESRLTGPIKTMMRQKIGQRQTAAKIRDSLLVCPLFEILNN
jgi:hypothetical protein